MIVFPLRHVKRGQLSSLWHFSFSDKKQIIESVVDELWIQEVGNQLWQKNIDRWLLFYCTNKQEEKKLIWKSVIYVGAGGDGNLS